LDSNIDKTAVLLEALVSHSKAIAYFALDVSNRELERNLARLAGKIPTLAGAIHGLCGTYDDLIRALDGPLARLRSSEVTFLWFGNSFANAPPETSMAFLSNLLARCHGHSKLDSSKTQALVGIDGCRDSSRVLEAYGTRTGVHRDFLFHALHHANEVLGQHVFFREHWDLQTHFDEHSGLLKQNFVAKRNIELLVERKRLQIHKGEEVNICQSGKWDQREVKLVAEAAAIQMTGDWHHEDGDYGKPIHLRLQQNEQATQHIQTNQR
jgi:L-histidine Nalpha-methyltransferase / hercynylcysteine S-oxide synthase